MEFYNIIVKFHDIYGTVGIKEVLWKMFYATKH